jgi:hypothetical protein
MSRSARLGLLAATLLASTTASVGLLAPAGAITGPSILVHGTLLVVPAEEPGGVTGYGVALAGGDIVPVRGRFDPAVRSGATFDGRLAIPSAVVDSLAERGDSGSAAALRIVDQRHLSLAVVGTPTVSEAAVVSGVATTHTQYVAALDNKGAIGEDDTQLLDHVSTVGGYWQAEANGAIAGITVPATVKHYGTSVITTDCGLGSDFFSIVQEAAAKFPGTTALTGGPDQLVIFVPESCSSGGVVGEGTLGSSFASGGALIVKAQSAIEGTYAHETGHNYGFSHANARYAGTSLEYYGVYDVMGFALGGFNQLTALSTPFRVFQGVTDPGEIQDVDPPVSPAPVHVTATIQPRGDGSGLRSVRVQDPDTGRHLYLDYRAGSGQDAGAFYADTADGSSLGSALGALHYAPGVTITTPRAGSGVDTLVVDSQGDTSLGTGASWSNTAGDLTVTVTSLSASGATIEVDYTPVITPAPTPTVSGTPRVGRTLTVAAGTWMSGVAHGYQWYVGGAAVAGATGTAYTPRASDVGNAVRVTVTATKAGFPTLQKTSARTSAVALGVLTTTRPRIVGRAEVGETLTARPGTWSAGATFAYAWYADGRRIKHRSGATLKLVKAQKGTRVTVKVIGTKSGYSTAARTSARTMRVH